MTVIDKQRFPNLSSELPEKLQIWIPRPYLSTVESVLLTVYRLVFAVLRASREGREAGKGLTDWGKIGHEPEYLTDHEEHGARK